jgi:L-iditol 2-dehydrogenase
MFQDPAQLPDVQRVVFLLGPEQVELREIAVPRPSEGEVVVRIRAATTCGTDVKVFRRGGHPRMLRVPCPFGHELAGEVAALGEGVTRFGVGQRVVVANSAPCGECEYCEAGRENLCTDLHYINGAFAEYILVPKRFVATNTHAVPPNLPYELAALAEPLACVLNGVDACDLQGSEDVVVYGAGPIGLLFVGVFASSGHRVVLADVSEQRLEAGRRLGATDTVVLSTGGGQADIVRARARRSSGFDVALDATGVPEVWRDAIASVRPGGLANLFGGCAPGTMVPLDTHLVHYSELTIKGVYHHRPATFARALELLDREAFDARVLLSAETTLEGVGEALQRMIRREALKLVVRP